MNATSEEIVKKFNKQNVEIIKQNIKLNQKITQLESKVLQLQAENLQLTMENNQLKNNKKIKKSTISVHVDEEDMGKQQAVNNNAVKRRSAEEDDASKQREKRSCTSKPINYALPKLKSKLRKGDPHTFGNQQEQ